MSKQLSEFLYYHEDGPPVIDIYCGDCLEIMPMIYHGEQDWQAVNNKGEVMKETIKVVNEGHRYEQTLSTGALAILQFQDGVVPEVGENGWQNEQVLEVLIDRMQFLNGKFPCRKNSIVITKLEEALMWLNKRTADRIKRGVEGKHVK